MDDWISKLWPIYAMEYYSARKEGMKHWYTLSCAWTWETLCQLKEPRHNRSHIVGFYLYDICRLGKSMGTGQGQWERSHCLVGTEFSFRMMKYFGTRPRWWLYNTGNVPVATKLFTLKYLIKRRDLGCYLRWDMRLAWATRPRCTWARDAYVFRWWWTSKALMCIRQLLAAQ